jgi:hypothetical protein
VPATILTLRVKPTDPAVDGPTASSRAAGLVGGGGGPKRGLRQVAAVAAGSGWCAGGGGGNGSGRSVGADRAGRARVVGWCRVGSRGELRVGLGRGGGGACGGQTARARGLRGRGDETAGVSRRSCSGRVGGSGESPTAVILRRGRSCRFAMLVRRAIARREDGHQGCPLAFYLITPRSGAPAPTHDAESDDEQEGHRRGSQGRSVTSRQGAPSAAAARGDRHGRAPIG